MTHGNEEELRQVLIWNWTDLPKKTCCIMLSEAVEAVMKAAIQKGGADFVKRVVPYW